MKIPFLNMWITRTDWELVASDLDLALSKEGIILMAFKEEQFDRRLLKRNYKVVNPVVSSNGYMVHYDDVKKASKK